MSLEVHEIDLTFFLPRTIGYAVRLRKRLEKFHPTVYNDGPVKKIGFSYDLNHGISEPVGVLMIRSRFRDMGQALMRKAFETSLAADPARFSVFVEMAERVGEQAVLEEKEMWEAARKKDYWGLNEAFLSSNIINAYGPGKEGRKRVAYLGRVLVEGEIAI